MITLSDITLYSLLPQNINLKDMPEWQKTLIKYEIYNCQKLYDYMSTKAFEFQDNKFYKIISIAMRLVNRSNFKPDIYSFDSQVDSNKKRLFSIADRSVTASRLPTFTIDSRNCSSKILQELNISTLKYLLSKLTLEGNNGIYFYVSPKTKTKQQLLDGIPLYYEQLEKAFASLQNPESFEGNLFDIDMDAKQHILKRYIRQIVEYLLENGDTFIWGPMRKNNKYELLCDLKKGRYNDFIAYILRVIRDYTSLKELEKEPLNEDYLKKFIIKPKM